MVSQELLDLTTMLLTEGWDINYDVKEVHRTMEDYFQREYDINRVHKAIDTIINENQNKIIELPDDFRFEGMD